MAITRRELRRMVADKLNDILDVVASSAGSVNTLQDAIALYEFDNTFSGSQILITSGHVDNVGREARVVRSSQQYASVTFIPELPQPVAQGDTAELYNLHGSGWTIRDYNRVLAAAVASQRTRVPVPVSDLVGPALVRPDGTLVIDLPTNYIAVYAIRGDADGIEVDVRPARYGTNRGWVAVEEDRIVEIRGPEAAVLEGKDLTVYGYARHPALTTDDSLCYMDPTWVVLQTASDLMMKRKDRSADQWSVEFARQAAARIPELMIDWEPNATSIREIG